MPVTKIDIAAVEPFADGKEFGDAGPYVRIHGVARGELDPAAPQNAVVVDLDKAERNARGMIDYELDLFILRPADPRRGNGTLVYDVTNRGRKVILGRLDEAPTNADINDPRTARDAGLGFTLGRGWTLVWSGWDSSAPRANNGMTARLPSALENGRSMVRRIRHEFHIGTRTPGKGDLVALSYPSVSTDNRQARLTVRDRESDARTELPSDSWEFVDARTIRLLPEGTLFAPYRIYELWYEATGSRVIGVGFAAVRDLVSFLRRERADRDGTANPLLAAADLPEGAGIARALAFGVSQSGRFLRHFLELGMNDDGTGRRVFDGVLTHVAGAGKTFANHGFAMPGRTATQHEDRLYPENWFPFGSAVATDPFSGRRGSLLQGKPTDPLMIEVNTSTEYWQKGASLVHTDPAGSKDAALPPGVRVYMIAGTQHGGGPGTDPSPGPCVNPRNPHSASPALRALLVALEEWVRDGIAPPDSRVPTLADFSLVAAETVTMPAMPGFAAPAGANRIAAPVDWVDPPERLDNFYGARVCAVDADGNEIAGIRLPPVAVPLGTYTGWNVYRAQPCELCDRDGSLIPFAGTRAEREAAGDPRPSLAERYGGRDTYIAKVRAAAAALVAGRLLLPADAEAYVRVAESCDRF
ncbi:MAG: alpha/beta hydrolase domain-containing protein [Alphaproteobacteria bacterium]